MTGQTTATPLLASVDVASPLRAYAQAFDAYQQALNGGRRGWLYALRQRAIEEAVALGFPSARDESWRYTRLKKIKEVVFASAPRLKTDEVQAGLLEQIDIEALRSLRLDCINGRWQTEQVSSAATPALGLSSFGNDEEAIPAGLQEQLARVAPPDGEGRRPRAPRSGALAARHRRPGRTSRRAQPC